MSEITANSTEAKRAPRKRSRKAIEIITCASCACGLANADTSGMSERQRQAFDLKAVEIGYCTFIGSVAVEYDSYECDVCGVEFDASEYAVFSHENPDKLSADEESDFDTFVEAYCEYALQLSQGFDETSCEYMSKRARREARKDVRSFFVANRRLWAGELNAEQAGELFLLTRNGHGHGFWAEDLKFGRELTERAHAEGTHDVLPIRGKWAEWHC